MAGAKKKKKKGQDFLIQGPWELPKLATSLHAPISAPQAWNSYTIPFSLSHASVFCVLLKPYMVTQAPLVSPSNLQPLRGLAFVFWDLTVLVREATGSSNDYIILPPFN